MLNAIVFSKNDAIIQFFQCIFKKSDIDFVQSSTLEDVELQISQQTIIIILDIQYEEDTLCKLKKAISVPLLLIDSTQCNTFKSMKILNNLTGSYVEKENLFTTLTPLIQINSQLKFDIGRHCVIKNNEELYLSSQEFKILYLLCMNIGKTLTKQELIKFADLTNRSPLYVHINKLREKIEDDPSNPRLIITERGKGYKLLV